MTPRFIARQLSHPRGILGRLIVRLMNRHNARINAFAVTQVAPSRTDRVLEIGFGGGATLASLVESGAFVAGLDRSPYVIARANARFAEAVRAGRAEFRMGEVETIPFADASFTKICTVNTVYFWPSLEKAFAAIRAALAPGGRLVVGFLPKEHMERLGVPEDIFTPRTEDDVVNALSAVGFTDVRLERPRPTTPWAIAVCTR